MSLYGSFALDQHFAELATPVNYGSGVISAATRRARAQMNLMGAAAVSDALKFGIGTSSSPESLGSTAGNALNYRFDATHTSGDMRGEYLRLRFSGAGGSGEALRPFAEVNNVSVATGGTVNGVHATLQINGASGAVSGAGNALRVTLGIGASCNPGGTLAGIQLDSDFAGTATVPTNAACLRVTNSNTGVWSRFLRIPNASNNTIFATHATDAMSHSIRCVTEGGTVFYIMCTTTATNRGGGA